MTTEKLEKAKELQSDIDFLKADLRKWENATGFEKIELSGLPIRSGGSIRLIKFLDFDAIKTEAIKRLKELIIDFEKQFADLQ